MLAAGVVAYDSSPAGVDAFGVCVVAATLCAVVVMRVIVVFCRCSYV